MVGNIESTILQWVSDIILKPPESNNLYNTFKKRLPN